MRHRNLIAIVTACVAMACASSAAADWGALGDSLTPTNVNPLGAPSIAAVGGVPYVAYSQPVGSAQQVFVQRWTGSVWTEVGSSTLNVDASATADSPSIADVAGVPYVAWAESGHVYVKAWNGSFWTQVGGDLSFTANAFRQSITSVGTIPYVSFIENGSVFVKQWNGSTWIQVGTAVNPSLMAQEETITNIGGVPWVAYTVFNSGYDLYVATLSGGSWLREGPLNVNANHTAQHLSLIGVGSDPYLAWEEYNPAAGHEFVYVKREGNSIISWPAVGAPLNFESDDDAADPALTTLDGQPLIGWQDNFQLHDALYFDRWTGLSWQPVGTALAADANGADLPAFANVGGVPYVAWQGLGTTHLIRAGALLASFSSGQSLATDTGALLSARVADFGAQMQIEFQYGPGASLTQTTAPQTTDGSGSATVDQTITGLRPSTAYSWRAVQFDGMTTTAVGPTQTFTTPGAGGTPGPPGKVELVTCQIVIKKVKKRVHGKKRTVRKRVKKCTTKLVNGPVTFTTAAR